MILLRVYTRKRIKVRDEGGLTNPEAQVTVVNICAVDLIVKTQYRREILLRE